MPHKKNKKAAKAKASASARQPNAATNNARNDQNGLDAPATVPHQNAPQLLIGATRNYEVSSSSRIYTAQPERTAADVASATATSSLTGQNGHQDAAGPSLEHRVRAVEEDKELLRAELRSAAYQFDFHEAAIYSSNARIASLERRDARYGAIIAGLQGDLDNANNRIAQMQLDRTQDRALLDNIDTLSAQSETYINLLGTSLEDLRRALREMVDVHYELDHRVDLLEGRTE